MNAIQLDLFSGMAIETVATPPTAEIQQPTNQQHTHQQHTAERMIADWIYPCSVLPSIRTLDPCVGCQLKELCSWDDCGMHLFDLDDAEKNYYDFEEWLSDPW